MSSYLEQKVIVAKNLRHHRKKKQMTQEQLSEESGVAVRTIQRIENAKVEPHVQTLSLLAKSLGLQVHELSQVLFADCDQKEDKVQEKWLLMLHLSPIAGFLIPFANIVIPLFLWIFKRDDNPLYDEQGREVVNFHLTITLAFMIGVVLLIVVFELGLLLLIILSVYTLTCIWINSRRIREKKDCGYPLTLKIL